MPDLQHLTQPADPIHTKLLEVDSELAAQETQLIAQLKTVQEKRKSLKTVMELFNPADLPAVEPANKPESVAEDPTASPSKPLTPPPTAETESATTPLQAPRKTLGSATRQRATQRANKKKTNKQPPSWQPYIRPQFGRTSLAELVAKILQREPVELFGISTMMQAIFVDEMPKEV